MVTYSIKKVGSKKVPREKPLEVRVFPEAEQLIPDVVWFGVQDVLADRLEHHVQTRRTSQENHWYSGVLYSDPMPSEHGFQTFSMSAEPLKHRLYVKATSNKGQRPAYSCCCRSTNPARPTDKCSIGCPQADELNEALDKFLHELTTSKGVIDEFRRSLLVSAPNVEGQKASVLALLDGLTRRQKRATDLYIDGEILKEDYDVRVAAILTEREAHERILVRLNETPAMPTPATLKKMAKEWAYDPTWTPEKKRAWITRWVSAIVLSRDAVESITIKISAEDGSTVNHVSRGDRTWVSLLGYRLGDRTAKAKKAGLLLTPQAAERLGIKANRLGHLVQTGIVPRPVGRHTKWMVWTPAEVEAARQILATQASYAPSLPLPPAPADPSPTDGLLLHAWIRCGAPRPSASLPSVPLKQHRPLLLSALRRTPPVLRLWRNALPSGFRHHVRAQVHETAPKRSGA